MSCLSSDHYLCCLIDIDECNPVNGTHDCDLTKSTCNNTIGSFVCDCNAGYVKQPSGECEQVFNECLMDIEPICDPKADCETNLPSSKGYFYATVMENFDVSVSD